MSFFKKKKLYYSTTDRTNFDQSDGTPIHDVHTYCTCHANHVVPTYIGTLHIFALNTYLHTYATFCKNARTS